MGIKSYVNSLYQKLCSRRATAKKAVLEKEKSVKDRDDLEKLMDCLGALAERDNTTPENNENINPLFEPKQYDLFEMCFFIKENEHELKEKRIDGEDLLVLLQLRDLHNKYPDSLDGNNICNYLDDKAIHDYDILRNNLLAKYCEKNAENLKQRGSITEIITPIENMMYRFRKIIRDKKYQEEVLRTYYKNMQFLSSINFGDLNKIINFEVNRYNLDFLVSFTPEREKGVEQEDILAMLFYRDFTNENAMGCLRENDFLNAVLKFSDSVYKKAHKSDADANANLESIEMLLVRAKRLFVSKDYLEKIKAAYEKDRTFWDGFKAEIGPN